MVSKIFLPGVKHVLVVASGKGGVGKTTVTVNLAFALQRAGASVGIFDADVYGPNVPLMLGVHRQKTSKGYATLARRKNAPPYIPPLQRYGLKIMSVGLLVAENEVIDPARSPDAVGNLVVQTLRDVVWGDPDYLLIDLLPSAGQPQAALVERVPIDGVVIVTTPQDLSLLDDLAQAGKIRYYGVSVEKVEEAIKAIQYPNVQTVQIIFNIFRQRPSELFFRLAQAAQVGILARVPLASGLLTGKMSRETTFTADDHRQYNRHGEAFDVGETFSGVDFARGLAAVERLRPLLPPGATMAQLALRWILMFDAVSCAIPGAKNRAQALDNVNAANLPPLSDEVMAQIQAIYDEEIKEQVHQRW